MNRKVWIIIVIAAILAFAAAAIIVDKIPKPLSSEEQNIVNEQPITNEETVKPIEEATKEEAGSPKLTSEPVSAPQKVIKKDTQKANNEKKEVTLQASVETKEEVQPIVESSVIEDSGNIVVLKEFKAQNAYKYIFTPERYKSKQY